VPDAATAIKIAVAVWKRIYSETEIAREKPYRAYLRDDVWIVTGSLPENFVGGVAYVKCVSWRVNGLTRQCSEPRPATMNSFHVVSSSSLQTRTLLGAVADPVSR
jgi:NTF2 fold immunity protein of polymorphic toxin system component